MPLIRKIDWYGQLILICCMLLSIPFLYIPGIGIGLILLDCWQLISALLNTSVFMDTGYKKPIVRYWIFCAADLGSILFLWQFESSLTSGYIIVLGWITTGAALFIAGYYLKIYYRLIELIFLRNELDGLTKSKH
ncbi:MAG TPA: hypothetical protein VFH08_16615 [Chitinophagaceae bacterium]|nr:hypothetical protein [Chitinophagaceae bacterium]